MAGMFVNCVESFDLIFELANIIFKDKIKFIATFCKFY